MKIETPDFVKNVYRDLRDRRLLLPVVLLAVALVAVPILLTRHANTEPVPASTGPEDSDSAAVPAVVTQELGVTKYRNRLDRLQSKDPFRQPPSAVPQLSNRVKNASITNSNIPSTDSTSSSSVSTSSTSSTSSTGSVPPVSSTTSSGGTTSGSTSSGGSPSVVPNHHTRPDVRYYAWRVSVKVGEPNHLKERAEVQRLALLPSDSKPVVSFLGANEDGSKAVFLVSSDVDSVDGEGHCLPNHRSCQYFVMRPGDKAHFHYAPNNTRYNLVLVDIHPVDVTDKLPKKTSGKGQSQQKLPVLGDG